MIDFGKLYCDIHPNEIITNFCLKQTCMVGLCATCICTHTQYHVNNKTTPEYQNIRNTFSSMHETIRKKINSLETQKNRIEKITQFIQTKRKALKQNIEQTRTQAIAVVNNFFDNKQKCMLRQMQSQQKKMGLHSQQRMESLLNSLIRQTSVLLTSAQQINSQNFLQSYQRIKTQTLFNAAKLQDQISREIDRNEDFETIINTNDEYINNIVRVLDQSLHLNFKMNQRPFGVRDQNPLIINQSTCVYPQKRTSQFQPQIIQQSPNQSNFVNKPSADSNIFSALSFSNMPEMIKQQTAKFYPNEPENGTTKSIALPQSEKTSVIHSGRQSKSFINDLSQSTTAVKQNLGQAQLFKQKDINVRPQHQSLMRSSVILNRNHQSQIIVNEKPLGYQSSGGWFNPRQNNHQQSLNQSLIQNAQHFSQEKQKINSISHLNIKNQSAVNLHQIGRQPQISFQSGQKLNFVPQIYDTAQFNRNAQSQVQLGDSKKMKKSGLTLLKVNHSTLREKPEGQ